MSRTRVIGALSVAVLAPAVALVLLVTVGRRAGADPPAAGEPPYAERAGEATPARTG